MKFRALDFDYHNDAMARTLESRRQDVITVLPCLDDDNDDEPESQTRSSSSQGWKRTFELTCDDEFKIKRNDEFATNNYADVQAAFSTESLSSPKKASDTVESSAPSPVMTVHTYLTTELDDSTPTAVKVECSASLSTVPSARQLAAKGKSLTLRLDVNPSIIRLLQQIVDRAMRSKRTKLLTNAPWSALCKQNEIREVLNASFDLVRHNSVVFGNTHTGAAMSQPHHNGAFRSNIDCKSLIKANVLNKGDANRDLKCATVTSCSELVPYSHSGQKPLPSEYFGAIYAALAAMQARPTAASTSTLDSKFWAACASANAVGQELDEFDSTVALHTGYSDLSNVESSSKQGKEVYAEFYYNDSLKDNTCTEIKPATKSAANLLIDQICSNLDNPRAGKKQRKRSMSALKASACENEFVEDNGREKGDNPKSAKRKQSSNSVDKTLAETWQAFKRKRSALCKAGTEAGKDETKALKPTFVPTSATLRHLLRVQKEPTTAEKAKHEPVRTSRLDQSDDSQPDPILPQSFMVDPASNANKRMHNIFAAFGAGKKKAEKPSSRLTKHRSSRDNNQSNVANVITNAKSNRMDVNNGQDVAHFERYTSKKDDSPLVVDLTESMDFDCDTKAVELTADKSLYNAANTALNIDKGARGNDEPVKGQAFPFGSRKEMQRELEAFGLLADELDEETIKDCNDDELQDSESAVPFDLSANIHALCSEGFIENWTNVARQLACGGWDSNGNVSQRQQGPIVPKIHLVDTKLVDSCGIDIELCFREAILVIPTVKLESDSIAKAQVIDLAQKAALGRYKRIHVVLCYEKAPNASVSKRIIQLQTAALYPGVTSNTSFSFKTVPTAALASVIAETIILSAVPAKYDLELACEKLVQDQKKVDRARFLLSIMPLLTARGALALLHLCNTVTPQQPHSRSPFSLMFTSQRQRQQIMLAVTSTPSKAPDIHPSALLQLNKVLHVSLRRSYE